MNNTDVHGHRPFLKAYVIYGVLTAIYTLMLLVLLGMLGWLFAAVLSIDWRPTPQMIGWIRSVTATIIGYYLFRRVILVEVVPRLSIQDAGKSVENRDTEQSPVYSSKPADGLTENAQA